MFVRNAGYSAIIQQPQHAQQKLQQNYVKKLAILGINTLNYDNLQLEGSKTATALKQRKAATATVIL